MYFFKYKMLDELLLTTHAFRFVSPKDDAGGCAIYSRFFAIHLRTVPPTVEGSVFPAQIYQIQVGSKMIIVVNVHLRPPLEAGGATMFSMVNTKRFILFFSFFFFYILSP